MQNFHVWQPTRDLLANILRWHHPRILFQLSRLGRTQSGNAGAGPAISPSAFEWTFSLSWSRRAFRIVAINEGGYVFNNVFYTSRFIHNLIPKLHVRARQKSTPKFFFVLQPFVKKTRWSYAHIHWILIAYRWALSTMRLLHDVREAKNEQQSAVAFHHHMNLHEATSISSCFDLKSTECRSENSVTKNGSLFGIPNNNHDPFSEVKSSKILGCWAVKCSIHQFLNMDRTITTFRSI